MRYLPNRLLTRAKGQFAVLLAMLLSLPLVACGDPSRVEVQAAAGGTSSEVSNVAADTLDLPATNYYEIRTPKGRMVVHLFDDTPQHRDNFKTLVAEQAYDSTLFHRVIQGFMIQGGDPNSLDDDPMNDGLGGASHTVPAEIQSHRYHTRGALAAARQGDQVNPERRSSGSQFYIVHGMAYPDSVLSQIEEHLRAQIPDPTFTFSDSIRAVYMTEGGAPNLDRMYTVFGELVEGYDVLDAIAASQTPRATGQRTSPQVYDRPSEDVWMVIRPLPDHQPPDVQ